ncbi:MAG: fimbria/pilus outer membrane usher protein [Enterobacterales bacterium]|uniref:fimbria/pilus outer membrane usher protein n=1 Tax=Serratia sp. (in: enterobacteria) TaxID=616 RepID=UPI003F38BF8A
MEVERFSRKSCKSIFCLTKMTLLIIFIINKSEASTYKFNPEFINDSNLTVADLSSFEQGLELQPGTHNVDIYVNKEYLRTDNLTFEIKKNKTNSILTPCISGPELLTLGVKRSVFDSLNPSINNECIDLLKSLPDFNVEFDQQALKVYFSIPQTLLDKNARGYIPSERWDSGLPTAMINYTFSGADYRYHGENSSDRQSYFLSLNGGMNIGEWRLRSQQNWNYSSPSGGEWSHIKSYLQREIRFLKSQLTLGDTNTSLNIFDSIGLRGIQIESKDSMLPDSLQGFAPVVRGIAKSNARVSIRQNGNVIYQTFVAPGAFLIDDLYATPTSGNLQVEIEEENGQITRYSMPYSSVQNLLREGRVKYAASVGEYRSGYNAMQNNPLFFQGSLFFGVSDGWTLYGGTQISQKYRSAAIGVARNMGGWGALSADITHAQSELADGKQYHGNSLLLRYAKSITDFGTNLNFAAYRYSTDSFYSLSDTTYQSMSGEQKEDITDENGRIIQNTINTYNLRYAKKAMSQILVSQSLKDYGSMYFSFNRQNYWNTEKASSNTQIGYSGNVGSISYTLSYSQNRTPWTGETDKIANFALSLPLADLLPGSRLNTSNSARLNVSTMHENNGTSMQSVGLSGSALQDNKLNYSVYQHYRNNAANGGNASLNYKGRYGIADLGYSYTSDSQFAKYGISGGVVLHEGGITLGQQLSNTNILVKAEGAPDITIANNTGIKTDSRGYAIIPYATAYRENRVQLDVETLGQDVELDEAIKTVIPTEGALVRATFNTHVGYKAMFNITYDGQPLPFGSIVNTDEESISSGIVGDNGIVYLSGLSLSGQLKVQWGKLANQSCIANYDISNVKRNEITGIHTTSIRCK